MIHSRLKICFSSFCILLSLGLVGCKKPFINGSTVPPAVGYQCLPVPSEFMEAGSVFSVDSAGFSSRLGRVNGVTLLTSNSVGFPSYESSSSVGAGLFLSTLEKLTASTGWDAKVDLKNEDKVTISTSYNGLSLQVIEGQPEKDAIKWFKEKGYTIDTGTKVYFIREALQAKEINYKFTDEGIIKIGGEAKVKELVEGKLALLDKKDNETYALNTKFASPVNACIKPRELKVSGRAATGQQMFEFADVKEPINIKDTH